MDMDKETIELMIKDLNYDLQCLKDKQDELRQEMKYIIKEKKVIRQAITRWENLLNK